MKRLLPTALGLATIVVLAGCSGRTTGATVVTSTSARLNATYLNAAANDYRLASGSLGVDDGTPGGGGYSVPPLDRLGRPRPAAGTQVDIGAHERQPNDP